MEPNRRQFLYDVGKGMLVAGIGTSLAADLGVGIEEARAEESALNFGKLEALADHLQQCPAERLIPDLVKRLNDGLSLKRLVSAAAMANARTFGGEDYIGFHTFMALAPSLDMSKELPADRRALPVLKVLYRNAAQMEAFGGRRQEVLKPVAGKSDSEGTLSLRDSVRKADVESAERAFAKYASKPPREAFDAIQPLVEDDADVHRVVLAYRAFSALDLVGREHAHTLLRQSVRYCAKIEQGRLSRGQPEPGIRKALPLLMERYGLFDEKERSRIPDDAWLDQMSYMLTVSTPEQAAEAVASALAEGFSPTAVGEALALAANLQVLRDPGRAVAQPGKPVGSVHGDSIGVHASDSMNAWRNIASVCGPKFALPTLVVAGYHVARGQWDRPGIWDKPFDPRSEEMKRVEPVALLSRAESAIRANDQQQAAALVHRYGELGLPARPAMSLLLKYATTEDGALHAEKFYKTATEEFERARPAFKWRHLVGLARVTASEFGRRAAGVDEACRLLGVTA